MSEHRLSANDGRLTLYTVGDGGMVNVVRSWALPDDLAACLPPLLHACCTQEAVDVMAAALAQEGPF